MALAMAWPGSAMAAEALVFSGLPVTTAFAHPHDARQQKLSDDQAQALRTRVVKRGAQYFWGDSPERPLLHSRSGAVHRFIDPQDGTCLAVLAEPIPLEPGRAGYMYLEVRNRAKQGSLITMSLWGFSQVFAP